jgi:DNA-directed RNA polymerase specialized sigma24 family protein
MGTRASQREGSRGTSPPADQDAIEELYVRHAPAMVRLAYLLTHDGALAEDLVQDAFVRVVGRMGRPSRAERHPASTPAVRTRS